MEIPKDLLDPVVFFCVKDEKGNFKPAGTGFMVGIPDNDPSYAHQYVVTAKHNFEKLDGRDFSIRVNGREGGKMDVSIAGARWFDHPTDNTVDVAVLPFGYPVDHKHRFIPEHMFLKRENIANGDVDVGGDVFVVGLFNRHHGQFSNLPIVRVGNIAMLPNEDEKIAVKWHAAKMEAYLIECRSIGGLSGSPAFFHQGFFKLEGSTRTSRERAQIYLGGLIHGHWDTEASKVDGTEIEIEEEKNVNVGIAIVTPAHKILEVLMQKELQEQRAAARS